MSSSTPSFSRAGFTNSRSSAWGTGVAATLSVSAWTAEVANKAAKANAAAGASFFNDMVFSRRTNSLFTIQPCDEAIAEHLKHLHHDDEYHHGHEHHIGLVALV